jgi:hypothetical protein
MEKLSGHTEEVDESTAEKIKNLFDRFDSLYNRNPKKALLIAALAFASGTGAITGMGEYMRYRYDKVGYLNSEIHQKIYEDFKLGKAERGAASRLRQEIGVESVAFIEGLESVTDEEGRKRYIEEHKAESLTVSGFDVLSKKYGGPSNEEMKEVVGSLPTTYQIDAPTIRYEDEKMPLPERYGIKEKGSDIPEIEAAHASPSANEIVFSAGARGSFWFDLSCVLHEEAHLKDWSTNKSLTLEERMTLVQEVIDRVNAPDRFRSAYVESIKNPNRQVELDTKATEYYAEITEAYFDRTHFLLSQKDKQIIEQVVHETNPTFTERDRRKVGDKIDSIVHAKFPPYTGPNKPRPIRPTSN